MLYLKKNTSLVDACMHPQMSSSKKELLFDLLMALFLFSVRALRGERLPRSRSIQYTLVL